MPDESTADAISVSQQLHATIHGLYHTVLLHHGSCHDVQCTVPALAGPAGVVTLLHAHVHVLPAAAPRQAGHTSFWDFQRALNRANGASVQGSPHVKTASSLGSGSSTDGSVQGSRYGYDAPSFTTTTAGLTVPNCGVSSLEFAK